MNFKSIDFHKLKIAIRKLKSSLHQFVNFIVFEFI